MGHDEVRITKIWYLCECPSKNFDASPTPLLKCQVCDGYLNIYKSPCDNFMWKKKMSPCDRVAIDYHWGFLLISAIIQVKSS